MDYESINNLTPTLSNVQSAELTQLAEDTLHRIYNTNFPQLSYDDIISELDLATPKYFTTTIKGIAHIKMSNPFVIQSSYTRLFNLVTFVHLNVHS